MALEVAQGMHNGHEPVPLHTIQRRNTITVKHLPFMSNRRAPESSTTATVASDGTPARFSYSDANYCDT